jgi:hypothetical protein
VGTIAIWPPPFPLPASCRALVIPSNAAADAAEWFDSNLISREVSAVGISTNEIDMGSALAFWVAHEKLSAPSVVNADEMIRSFFVELYAISATWTETSAASLEKLFKHAPEAVRVVHGNFEVITELSALFGSGGTISHIARFGFLRDFKPDILDQLNWVDDSLVRVSERDLKAFDRLALKGKEFESFAILQRIVHIALLKTVNGHWSERCDAYSRLNMLVARVLFSFGQFNASILLGHRALEAFLFARCFEVDLMGRRADGRFFFHNSSEMPSVSTSISHLKSSRFFKVSRDCVDHIGKLNKIRNRSYYTHSVYGYSREYSDRYLSTVVSCMSGISKEFGRSALEAMDAIKSGLLCGPWWFFASAVDISPFFPEANH